LIFDALLAIQKSLVGQQKQRVVQIGKLYVFSERSNSEEVHAEEELVEDGKRVLAAAESLFCEQSVHALDDV
jgi:hypothetical protein